MTNKKSKRVKFEFGEESVSPEALENMTESDHVYSLKNPPPLSPSVTPRVSSIIRAIQALAAGPPTEAMLHKLGRIGAAVEDEEARIYKALETKESE